MIILKQNDIAFILRILQECKPIVWKYFKSKINEVKMKEDNSPVTLADIEISRFLIFELTKRFKDIGVISEEGDCFTNDETDFWLIDPIDGTKSFIRGENTFTVNIGLIEDRRPTYGFIYVPIVDGLENGVIYYTDENKRAVKLDLDSGEKMELSVKNKGVDLDEILKKEVSVVTSRVSKHYNLSHIVRDIKVGKVTGLPSSLKFCKMAEGKYDIYVHSRNTHEWDTAAGHAIVLGAGGRLQNIDRSELLYNKERFLNAEFLVY